MQHILQLQADEQQVKRLKVKTFSVGSVLLNDLMTAVMEHVIPNSTLKNKLYQVNFHTTLSGEGMVTLIYHKKLDDKWRKDACQLRDKLRCVPSCTSGTVQVIGRSRKQKIEVAHNYVNDVMTVAGKTYMYRQVEGAFSQPNGGQSQRQLMHAAQCSANKLSLQYAPFNQVMICSHSFM